MVDIRSPHQKPLSFLEIDAPQLCLNNAAVFDHLDQNVDVLRRMCDARHDIELLRKLGSELHHGRVILSEKVHFVRGEFPSEILVR